MKIDYQAIFEEAQQAAQKAFAEAQPVPMIVGSPSSPLGNDVDPSKEMWFVSDGVCGFAWANFGDGRGALPRWFRSKGLGYKDYYGGWSLWSREFLPNDRSQSMQRKEAAMRAVVGVYRKYGFNDVGYRSRMD